MGGQNAPKPAARKTHASAVWLANAPFQWLGSNESVPQRLEMPSASCHAARATLEAIQQESCCEI
jgi:hypothetical protein